MFENIAILGAGTMGSSIALLFGMHGIAVSLYDINDEVLSRAKDKMLSSLSMFREEGLNEGLSDQDVLKFVKFTADFDEAVGQADFIIEAAPENLDIKKGIFKRLDEICSEDAIFATNTSSLSLSDIISDLSEHRKSKSMVCHFFNPGHIVPLLEMSYYGNMSEQDFNRVYELFTSVGKKCVKILKEAPGLIANRIQEGIIREVFDLMESGIASYEDIDLALTYGPAFRLATTGPISIVDLGGLDIWCTMGDNLLSVMNNEKKASDLIRNKVSEGKLGVKTGEGFYKYDEGKAAEAEKEFHRRLLRQLKKSVE